MKLDISERDRKLLVFLFLFVLIVGIGYWGIYPNLKRMSAIEKEMEKEQNTKSMNDMMLMDLPIVEADNTQLEKDIVTAKKDFYPIMGSDEIDKYVTGLALSYGLYAYDLEIYLSEGTTTLEPYQYSKKAQEGTDDYITEGSSDMTSLSDYDALFASEGSEDGEEGSSTGFTGIYTARVSMRLGGEMEKLDEFVEYLFQEDTKRSLRSFSWSEERNVEHDEDGSLTVTSENGLNVELELYMCAE